MVQPHCHRIGIVAAYHYLPAVALQTETVFAIDGFHLPELEIIGIRRNEPLHQGLHHRHIFLLRPYRKGQEKEYKK